MGLLTIAIVAVWLGWSIYNIETSMAEMSTKVYGAKTKSYLHLGCQQSMWLFTPGVYVAPAETITQV